MGATINTIAGYGTNQNGFGAAAASLDLRQATPEYTRLGRNQGVAVDQQGRIYVSATANSQIGRISAPADWAMQQLGEVLTTPTGSLPWKFYSPSAQAISTFYATTVNGKSAVRWSVTNADSRTVLYLQPGIIPGATGHGTVQVIGSGQLTLDYYNGGADTLSPTITLSDAPQTLAQVKTFNGDTLQYKIRSPLNQASIELTAWDASLTQSQQTGDTVAVAGRINDAGYSGDGGPGARGQLNYPGGIAVDSRGAIYIADTYNQRIRMVRADGTITTIAGNGSAGYSGDGRATGAKLNYPSGIAVDQHGNVYVADTYNNRVRCISSNGRIRTIAGTGLAGFGGDGGPATKAELNHPQGIAVGSDGIYVADTYNNRIRRIDNNGTISTVAGTGDAGFSGDNGPATAAALNTPFDIAVAASGDLYLADTVNNRIRQIAGGVITTIAGSGVFGTTGRAGGSATAAQLAEPLGVAIDNASGDLYVVESTQAVLRVVTA